MNVHFIAIGGSAMHNLAIALHKKGCHVTGSDDEIFEPSKSRLQKYGLLPDSIGWNPDCITRELDAVILGMHARKDNLELLKAQELGLKIFSYPEYIYEQSKDKCRVVIGGSHGKTSITSMIIHVLNHCGKDCDYMVGAQLEGFEVMVKLSDEASVMIIEGDEYLTSPIDLRPKFHVYMPNIALISGIAWDHINVFKTFEVYKEQFLIFANLVNDNGALIYCDADENVKEVCEKSKNTIHKYPYALPDYEVKDGITYILHQGERIAMQVFGQHNLMNINGARLVCNQLGIDDSTFYHAIASFKGASNRLERVRETEGFTAYKDFAHSPSKLKATTLAVKEQFPNRKLVACMELHTFSSLTAEFLQQYENAMNDADTAIVYFNPHTIEHKKLSPITPEQIKTAFNREDLMVFTESEKLQQYLQQIKWNNTNLLLMSSGNFDGIKIKEFIAMLGVG